MFNVITKTVIAFVLLLLLAFLMAPGALATGLSPSAMLGSIKYLPDSAKGLTVAKSPQVTRNQMPIIHDDAWIACARNSAGTTKNSQPNQF